MARAQTGGLVTGGGLDPYVAAASQQRSAQDSRMREAAMSEQGETKRQAMSGEAGVAQSAIQAASARAMQDARMADAERGRREDAEFTKAQMEMEQNYWKERQDTINAAEKELEQNRLDTAEKIMAEDRVAQERYRDKSLKMMDLNRKAMLNYFGQQGKNQSAAEKFVTEGIHSRQKRAEIIDLHGVAIDQGVQSFRMRDELDFDFTEGVRGLGYPTESLKDGALISKGLLREKVSLPKEDLKRQVFDSQMGVVDKTFTEVLHNKYSDFSEVSADMLSAFGIEKIARLVSEGKIPHTSFVALDGLMEGLIEQLRERGTQGDETTREFYRKAAVKWDTKRSSLRLLQNNPLPVKGLEGATVGSLVKQLSLLTGRESEEEKALREAELLKLQSGGADALIEMLGSVSVEDMMR